MRLTPKQASHLAAAVQGLVFLAGSYDAKRRVKRLQERGLLSPECRLTDAGREALERHIEADGDVDGYAKRKT